MIAQGLVKYTATLLWFGRDGEYHEERHAAWTPRRAVEMAWKRTRSMMSTGEARAFTTRHSEEVIL